MLITDLVANYKLPSMIQLTWCHSSIKSSMTLSNKCNCTSDVLFLFWNCSWFVHIHPFLRIAPWGLGLKISVASRCHPFERWHNQGILTSHVIQDYIVGAIEKSHSAPLSMTVLRASSSKNSNQWFLQLMVHNKSKSKY